MIQGLFTIYIKNPSGFKLCKWNAKNSIGKSRSEHALSIFRKIGKDRKYIAKGLELDGKPRKMWMKRNKPVETSQLFKEDNLFKQTGFSGNFPIGLTKNMCSIYFLSGITGIFMSMVNNQEFTPGWSMMSNTLYAIYSDVIDHSKKDGGMSILPWAFASLDYIQLVTIRFGG